MGYFESSLKRLSELEADWDDDGSPPPNPAFLRKAVQLKEYLGGDPCLCPLHCGGVDMNWKSLTQCGNRFDCLLAICEEDGAESVSFYADIRTPCRQRTIESINSNAENETDCANLFDLRRAFVEWGVK